MSESGIGAWLSLIGLDGWQFAMRGRDAGNFTVGAAFFHPDGRAYSAMTSITGPDDAEMLVIYDAAYQAGGISRFPDVICDEEVS